MNEINEVTPPYDIAKQDWCDKEIIRLAAENARYREALKNIVKHITKSIGAGFAENSAVVLIANNALEKP